MKITKAYRIEFYMKGKRANYKALCERYIKEHLDLRVDQAIKDHYRDPQQKSIWPDGLEIKVIE